MTASNGYVIYLYPGESTTGWCDHCLLPSNVTTTVLGMTDHGFSDIGTVSHCTGCESPES